MMRQILTKQQVDYVMAHPSVWGMSDNSLRIIRVCLRTDVSMATVANQCGVSDTRVGKLVAEVLVSIEARKRFAPRKCKEVTVRTIKLLQKAGIETETDLRNYVRSGGLIKDIPQIGDVRAHELYTALNSKDD